MDRRQFLKQALVGMAGAAVFGPRVVEILKPGTDHLLVAERPKIIANHADVVVADETLTKEILSQRMTASEFESYMDTKFFSDPDNFIQSPMQESARKLMLQMAKHLDQMMMEQAFPKLDMYDFRVSLIPKDDGDGMVLKTHQELASAQDEGGEA